MALVAEHKLRKTFSIERRPLMLKDYLRDDQSSCSSNGFKSFPRREGCTTVRFLLEIDLKTKDVDYLRKRNNSTRSVLQSQRTRTSKAASTTISALQRASEALLNAFKQLPFPSAKSSMPSLQRKRTSKKGSLLARCLSRKLLKRNFRRKAADHHKDEHTNTIKGWKMFREYLEERPQPSDQIRHQSPSPTTTTLVSHRVSTSSSSKSTYSNSWAESDFAADILRSSSGNSESPSENDAAEGKKDVIPSSERKLVSNLVGVSVGEDSFTTNSGQHNLKDWSNEEEKEQFSPVSVLDCPFEDDKEISSPPAFQKRLARMEGTKQKLMQKIRRFESLAQLEPVDLEKRIALSELEDESLQTQSPLRSCSNHVLNNNMFNEDEENETEKKVQELLKLMRSTTQSKSLMCKVDNLVSDFFTEKIEEGKTKAGCKEFDDQELLKVAEDWINGQHQELLMGWEVECGRKAYVKEVEKNGEWRKVNVAKGEVGLALELEIFTTLVNELVIDLFQLAMVNFADQLS